MSLLTRARTLGAAGLVGLLLSASGVGASVADAAPPKDTDLLCWSPVTWTSQSTLDPGAADVRDREKQLTDSGDLAVDGWAQPPAVVDSWEESGAPTFRIIVGSLAELHDVDVTVSLETTESAFTGISGGPTSPAGAATDPSYKRTPLSDLAEPQLAEDGRSFSWTVTDDAVMPSESSAQFVASVDQAKLTGAEPITVKITLTGHVPAPCEDTTEGSTGSTCEVDWRLQSLMDRRIGNYPNRGFIEKVRDTDNGLSEIQHFFIGERMAWRIPIGTTEPIEAGAQLVLTPNEFWTFDDPLAYQEQTGVSFKPAGDEGVQLYSFHQFYGYDQDFLYHDAEKTQPRFAQLPEERPTAELREDGAVVVTLPEMPADSHVMFTVFGHAKPDVDVKRASFLLSGHLTGVYPQEVLDKRGCSEASPTPTPTDEVTPTPTQTPTDEPTATPTDETTADPTPTSTDGSTLTPSAEPTDGADDRDDQGRDDQGRDDQGRDGQGQDDRRTLPRTGAAVGSALFGGLLLIGGGTALYLAVSRRRS